MFFVQTLHLTMQVSAIMQDAAYVSQVNTSVILQSVTLSSLHFHLTIRDYQTVKMGTTVSAFCTHLPSTWH